MNELWRAFGLRAIRGTLIWNFMWTLAALAIGYIVMHVGLERRMTEYVAQDLKENIAFIARPFKDTSTQQVVSWCRDIPRDQGKRFTVINKDGKVLCDNYANIASLVNHADRPEFIEALKNGHGHSTRSSSTIETTMVYASIRLIDNITREPLVLRIALPQGDLGYHLGKMRLLVVKNLVAVLFVLAIIFIWASIRVGIPLRGLEKKLSLFSTTNDKKLPETRNEWEKVDLTVDQIYKDLNSKIDEIAKSNDKIATIVESIADGLLAIGKNEKIILANAPFARAFTQSNARELTDRTLIDIIRDVDIRSAFLKTMEARSPVIQQVQKGEAKFELRVYPLFQGGREVLGAVGIFHDVTQTKLIQQMREDFVANVSHEVRTPLTAIKGYAQILTSLDEQETAEYKNYAGKIEYNVDRLANLFQDILSLSVLESRDYVIKENIDAKDLIQTVASNVRLLHQDKDIEVLLEIKKENIWVEPRLFEQVMTNLLDNAYKYTPNKGKVTIKTSTQGKLDVVEVIDTGHGIAKEAQPRVFERFYRVDSSRARDVGGTGLGLAIVKHAVGKHNGNVRIESEVGVGSRFIVELPSDPSA